MKLSERLKSDASWADYRDKIQARATLDRPTYNRLKTQVHFRLVEQLDIASITELPKEALAGSIRSSLEQITTAHNLPLNQKERTDLIADLMDEILGLGPIEGLVQDETVQDILVNGHDQVFVERRGILEKTDVQFRDDDHLMQVIDRIVSAVGRRVDESSPMVDARLPDGSRVNVIIPPLALVGPVVSIRKFGRNPVTIDQLLDSLALTDEMNAFLEAAVRSKLNILISGGTGAGKTTLLNILSGYIPLAERIVTIEDSAELRLNQPHVVGLESRPPNIEGRGEVTLTDLVKNSLRMRPDRIIVGEARGAEVMDMLQAMNTGHPGSMSTIHANTPKDALSRMEVMAGMGTALFSERALRGLIASAIHLIVQLARLPDGSRRVMSISEVHGMADESVAVVPLVSFVQEGVDDRGRVLGRFKGTRSEPLFGDHIRSHGLTLPEGLFSRSVQVG
ncbi:CpaF pilus assembly protein, ATPase CpaF [Desulfosarcina ovata subsp. sediminis]|uniref:CpaF pilus assembly protein, ATPase CpaF n=1 Tax=Desulfosarcina ovata subsp. sediminis TaxID=885957 RepID=A0A5K8A1Y3_9BACT|nr:CpaF family protein [Desulfosarcina ovata]BBO86507.1 CpaF pilus assembly protein, ATPase CpaF [Desulfosarcina ovata subsp. sediminis]